MNHLPIVNRAAALHTTGKDAHRFHAELEKCASFVCFVQIAKVAFVEHKETDVPVFQFFFNVAVAIFKMKFLTLEHCVNVTRIQLIN